MPGERERERDTRAFCRKRASNKIAIITIIAVRTERFPGNEKPIFVRFYVINTFAGGHLKLYVYGKVFLFR